MTVRQKAAVVEEQLRRVLWDCPSWGQLEEAAGVTDRSAFWRGRTEETAKAKLVEMIRAKLTEGGQ